ncbi:MAG: LysR family transcriptional regulator [Spirulinaceae cyanobacterium]
MIQSTLHQLEVFEAVARHGSFTRAAEELLITQPTVSSQVKQLSKAVGLPLYEQIGKQLYLTEAGKELLATCQQVFNKLENFEMKVADLKGTKQGRLNLTVVTTAKYFVPRILGSFCRQHPGIDVSLQVINHQQIQERMLENKDDLYIMSQPPQEVDLYAQPFLANPLVVLASADHPLAKETSIPLKSLNNESFIMREPGSGTRQAVQQLFTKHKITVRVRLELGSNEAIKQAVVGGLGISVLSQHSLVTEISTGELVILDVEHFPLQHRWYVTYLAGKKLSVVAETFLEYLLQESKKFSLDKTSELVQV